MARKRHPIEDLRTAIDCLPVDSRLAMLHGVRSNDIIVGAYTDRRGGICPMLAAHRCGGRTNLLAFAHAWDRFAQSKGRARSASEREVRILTTHLEASILAEHRPDMERAIREHTELVDNRPEQPARPARRRTRPGDLDRSRELRDRAGWAWMRPFRRYDDYENALARVEAERERLLNGNGDSERSPEREPVGV